MNSHYLARSLNYADLWCSGEAVDFSSVYISLPIPVTALSKGWVCGRSRSVIVGSNPAGGMDVCRL
jgi:hypothetical protein